MRLTVSPEFSADRRFRLDADHQLHEMLQQAVARLHGRPIDVHLHEQEIVLTGSVRSWAEKQAAQESIRSLSGSRRIYNELRVA